MGLGMVFDTPEQKPASFSLQTPQRHPVSAS